MTWPQALPEVLVVSGLLLATPFEVAGQDDATLVDSLSVCSTLPSSFDRLKCYDRNVEEASSPIEPEDFDKAVADCVDIASDFDRFPCYERVAADFAPVVTKEEVYSAPWLIGLEERPEHSGVVVQFGNSGPRRTSTFGPSDLAWVAMPAPMRVGTELQVFRVERTIADVGQVVVPTGLVAVATIGNGQVGVVVTSQFLRMQAGDFVRPLPPYALRPGQFAEEVSGGSEAMIMGFAGAEDGGEVGDIALIDLGLQDGLKIGDELNLYGSIIPPSVEGTVQVIGVANGTAATRIVFMIGSPFFQGAVVRMAKKMW